MATEKQVAFIARLIDEIEHSKYLERPAFDDSPRGIQAQAIWEQNRRDWMLCTMMAYDMPAAHLSYEEVCVLFAKRIREVRDAVSELSTKQASWLIDELKRGVLPNVADIPKL